MTKRYLPGDEEGGDLFAWIKVKRPSMWSSFPLNPPTTLTLPGAFKSDVDKTAFRGELWAPPAYRTKVVYYSGFPIPTNGIAEDGVEELDAMLHSVTGRITVYGHSMGAQIIYKWLREYGPTSDVPVDNVTFISAGNPERKYGGASVIDPSSYPAIYPGTGGLGVGYGLPTSPTPYVVIDVARQYDFWADHPDDLDNDDAITNLRGMFGNRIHGNYNNVGLGDGRNVKWHEGNVTYVLVPTFPLEHWIVQGWGWWPAVQRKYEAKYRPLVEAGYDRPVAVPISI